MATNIENTVRIVVTGLSTRQMPIQYALSNGFGFGGVNASLLFRRWESLP